MPLQATSGAASYDAFGGGVAAVPNYIEEVFASHLYTGNGSTQTINNGIDLAGKGGLTWFKRRNASGSHYLFDTARGNNFALSTNETFGQGGGYSAAFNFASTGFTLAGDEGFNTSAATYASWTFREAPKFFDVVTYTGTGVNNRQIAHNLGSVPGFMVVKSTNNTDNWQIYHRSISPINNNNMSLNRTDEVSDGGQDQWGNGITVIPPTDTVFTVGATNNQSGYNYVIYLFAHNAGGFGLSGTDNVISCGSYTTDASGLNSGVSLGYEPQWIMYKRTDSATGGGWYMQDNMRGMTANGEAANLFANTSGAESSGTYLAPTATGFSVLFAQPNATYIYIAIRRGPMKTPTTGTSVFAPDLGSSSGLLTYDSNFVVDFAIDKSRTASPSSARAVDRLRGAFQLLTPSTDAESSSTVLWDSNTNLRFNSSGDFSTRIGWLFSRAPGFFDEVCYTGNGSNPRTINHNLGVAPELMIFKRRNGVEDWSVYCAYMSSPVSSVLFLNLTDAQDSGTGRWNNTAPTSTVFSLGGINQNTATYVAYLFASCPGVSKVGSFTGTGTTQVINCGFTAGSRFVLIKRTDSTGDWYVWDSARGIVAGNDPYLLLNSTAAEVTNTDFIDTASTGFEISSTAPAAINASGGTFIFLAIA